MDTKTKKAEETKGRIISSARKLFNKKGFEATSVREITEAAGCAKGTFYLYFETKTDLLIYLIDEMHKNLSAIISNELNIMTGDPFAQIDNVLTNVCSMMYENDIDMRLIHTSEILGIITEQNIRIDYFKDLIEKISVFLSEGIKKGYFRKLNPQLYSKLIFSLVHQMLESSMFYKSPSDIITVKNEIGIIIRKILEK